MRNLPNNRRPLMMAILAAALLAGCGDDGGRPFEAPPVVEGPGWPTYAGAEGGTRFSPLNQINRSNVEDLEIAWTYNAGHLDIAPQLRPMVGFQVTPILLPEEAGRHLVLCDPLNRIMALDPATGEERWLFDPEIDLRPFAGRFNCRGVTHWRDPEAAEADACAHRLILATNDRRLVAVDARTGRPCSGFGEEGFVNVTPIILELQPANRLLTMQLNSPAAVVNGVIIIGGTADKFKDASSMNGAVRAFSARTGEHLWTFDTLIREPADDPESSAWHVGGANAWINMSWDSEHDLVFIPTASPAPNFYGGKRPGRQPLCEFRHRASGRHRGTGLALPGPASRPVGLGPADQSHPGGYHARRREGPGCDATDQAGNDLHLPPLYRRALLRDRGASGSDRRHARGRRFAHAAVSGQTAAAGQAWHRPGRRLGVDAL